MSIPTENVLENNTLEVDAGIPGRAAVSLEDIWGAIEADQFHPHFQPKVSLRGMELAGVEALMRWQHPQHGLLAAGAFLAVVADNFLFDELSLLMLEKSVAQCAAWRQTGLDVAVCVNLSPDLLRDTGLSGRILEKMNSHGVPPHRLMIEVTEAAVAQVAGDALETLLRLRAAGFGLAIDDFGTGRIEPDRLACLPATELKIDRRMLAGAARRPALRTVLQEAVHTARELNFRSVAEGIETREEWDLVNELGCDMAQGYFIARPMAGEDLPAWLELWTVDPFV